MRALDTNILVRLVIDDDEAQTAAATALLSSGERFLVTTTVLIETAQVLKSLGISKMAVIASLEALMTLPSLVIHPAIDAAAALVAMRSGLDVADAIHVYAAAERSSAFVTSDRDLVKRAKKARSSLRVELP
jgi:predicted nucleic acid-binding protein